MSFLIILSSCSRGLIVQKETYNQFNVKNTNVKSHVENEKILVCWNIKNKSLKDKLILELIVIFDDMTKESSTQYIYKSFGYTNFIFEKNKKIITYHVEIKTLEDKIIEEFNHQFWTELIE